MDENKFRYYTLLLTNDNNNSKIIVSEKNKYYVRGDNKSILVKILNEFKDIIKSYEINVHDITDICYKIDDTTNNYYKINEPDTIKHCTILSIDDGDHSKILNSKKNLYYTSNDCDYFGVDVDDYIFNDYDFFDEDYGDYDYTDNDYDYDYYYYDDYYFDYYYYYYYYDDDDNNNHLYYKKSFNYFELLVSVKNNIVNLIDNVDYNHELTLLVDNHRVCIC